MTKHIVIVTPIYPYPPDTGTKLRIFNLMRYLKEANFNISIIVCDSSITNCEIDEPLLSLCQNNFIIPPQDVEYKGGFISHTLRRLIGKPITLHPTLKKLLNAKLIEWAPDFVQAEKTFVGAQLDIEALHSQNIRIVLEEGGVHHLSYKRIACNMKPPISWRWNRRAKRLYQYESKLINQVDAVTAVSDIEATLLHEMNREANIITIPNGVSETIFNVEPKNMRDREIALFFCGKLSYMPNADAVKYSINNILPALKAENINVKMVVAGGDIPKDISDQALSCPQFELLGYVPNITECFQRYAIMINPMRLGGGTNLKLLEAMAHGMACVSTSIGAEGLEVENEKHVLIADNQSAFVSAIKRILEDDVLLSFLGSSARELIWNKYTWRNCVKPLIDFYHS